MSELRKNIATNEWTIIATERARRPDEMMEKDTGVANLPAFKENCPFCPGSEHKTPPEIMRVESGNSWQIRVIPNKFAAVSGDHPPTHINDGVIQRMDGIGTHEVIIETPLHNQFIPFMEQNHVENLIETFKKRYFELENKNYIKHVIIFKNHGSAAGTSLEHPHCQLIALPLIPTHIRDRIEESYSYYKTFGECPFCKMIHEEYYRKERMILDTEHFVAFIPYAAFSPFHTWILPKRHYANFAEISENEMKGLAYTLRKYFMKVYKGLNNPSFNFVIRSIPCREDRVDHFHWYIAVVVRLTSTAGFEMGSGMFINVSLPENDAAYLRGIE